MGNSTSISINEQLNGVFSVQSDIEYPIKYIRLYYSADKNEYCVLEDCDVNGEFGKHRKIMVVGFEYDGLLGEQAFYLSSGLNSIESMQKFLGTDYPLNTESSDVWLPFLGMGYGDIKSPDEYETGIKLLKIFFGCTERSAECLFGRFGKLEPNLMQISYCLGGGFWDNNVDIFIKAGFDIQKLDSLYTIIKDFPRVRGIKAKTNVECSWEINKYIASAMVYNYSPKLLMYKNKILRLFTRFKTSDFDYSKVKVDWRIIHILYLHGYVSFKTLGIKGPLPFERGFFSEVNFWNTYLAQIHDMQKNKPVEFREQVVPIVNEVIPIIKPEVKLFKETEKVESEVKLEKEPVKDSATFILGSQQNPKENRASAMVGEYYKQGNRIMQKRK